MLYLLLPQSYRLINLSGEVQCLTSFSIMSPKPDANKITSILTSSQKHKLRVSLRSAPKSAATETDGPPADRRPYHRKTSRSVYDSGHNVSSHEQKAELNNNTMQCQAMTDASPGPSDPGGRKCECGGKTAKASC